MALFLPVSLTLSHGHRLCNRCGFKEERLLPFTLPSSTDLHAGIIEAGKFGWSRHFTLPSSMDVGVESVAGTFEAD